MEAVAQEVVVWEVRLAVHRNRGIAGTEVAADVGDSAAADSAAVAAGSAAAGKEGHPSSCRRRIFSPFRGQ